MSEHRMRWRKGVQWDALHDDTRELDIEGALRASKTTICLRKVLRAVRRYPGLHAMICRWTDDAAHGTLKPAWREMCDQSGTTLTWHAEEQYDELLNGSRVYIIGLKTQDQTNRYAKFRGKTLGLVYIDQGEEVPQDIYLELAARLSQPDVPHQIIISPNAVEEDHWIAKEFPEDNSKPHRKYLPLSVYDNAHNLSESVIPSLERLYPVEHPKHRTMVLGKRGMNVIGEPVYAGAFLRSAHETDVRYDPQLALEMALDFGKHHPCVVFRQVSMLNQVRFVGGILGQSLYLDDFIDLVLHYRQLWFPHPIAIKECCDPAGASDTSHGTQGAVKILRDKGIRAVSIPDSNSPAVRLAVVERIAAQMRRRAADRSEAFVVSNDRDRWLRISADAVVSDRFLAAGFEAGYVWDPHTVSVANKQQRKPKKDGWYEHGQNCAEYLELNFGHQLQRVTRERQQPRVPHVHGEMAWAG